MQASSKALTAIDRVFLDRAIELAKRGVGSTSPNPPVGAVLVKTGAIVGEGYHHRAGEPHAEIEALGAAGVANGATLYVSLEPCSHFGKTPPCTQALIDARISRVVIGARDPNPITNGGGISTLTAASIAVDICEMPEALALIEPFKIAVASMRPYVALKMASSADGFVAARTGESRWLTGTEAGEYVRELRIMHDAVMVGAGTVRVDDPLLTVRPTHDRGRPYNRIVVCESDVLPMGERVFEPVANYQPTILLAPGGRRDLFEPLQNVADVIYVGTDRDLTLNLAAALQALRDRGIQSVLCEGGPTLAARLLEAHCVDRVYWLTAPMELAAPEAVPALASSAGRTLPSIEFERVERLGNDMLATGIVGDV